MDSEMGCMGPRAEVVFLQIWVLENHCNLMALVDYTGSEVCWYYPKIERNSLGGV